jgi:hypothetical protein
LWGYIHSADRENCSNGHLGAHIHLDVPDQEDGHETQCPICHTRDGGIGVGSINCDFRVDACSCASGILRPEVRGRAALQDE